MDSQALGSGPKVPQTYRLILDKAQPLTRSQFPHLYSQALLILAALAFPQAQARPAHTVSSCRPAHSPRGCPETCRHIYTHRCPECTHAHVYRPVSVHTDTRISTHSCRHIHAHTSRHTGKYTRTFTHIPHRHIPHSAPPPPHALALAQAATAAHTYAHPHWPPFPPKSAVHQLLVRKGLGEGRNKTHDSAREEGCGVGGVRGRGK